MVGTTADTRRDDRVGYMFVHREPVRFRDLDAMGHDYLLGRRRSGLPTEVSALGLVCKPIVDRVAMRRYPARRRLHLRDAAYGSRSYG